MESIWKIVLAFLIVITIASSGLAIIIGNANVTSANNYFEESTQVILESNYSTEIIEECIKEAEENGYAMSVQVHGKNQPGTERYAEIVMEYEYKIPILGVSETKTKRKIL